MYNFILKNLECEVFEMEAYKFQKPQINHWRIFFYIYIFFLDWNIRRTKARSGQQWMTMDNTVIVLEERTSRIRTRYEVESRKEEKNLWWRYLSGLSTNALVDTDLWPQHLIRSWKPQEMELLKTVEIRWLQAPQTCHCIFLVLAGLSYNKFYYYTFNKSKSYSNLNLKFNFRQQKPLIAQLIRIHVVTPKAPVHVTLNPRVQPGPSPCPVFVTGCEEPIKLSQSAYWVLRLPYPFQKIT